MFRTAILLLLLLPSLCIASNGRVLFVKGAVTVERGGKLYRAVKNAKLLEGDTISTGKGGRMHVRMSDRTLISLKSNTQCQIQAYRFAAEQRVRSDETVSKDRSIFRLFKGGFRAVTGLIGKRDRSAFGVSTPVATIGIRGTSFVVDLNDAVSNEGLAKGLHGFQFAALSTISMPRVTDGTLSDADDLLWAAADGTQTGQRLTVGVADGSVILTSTSGSLVLENGEFGEVFSGQPPSRLLVPPGDSEASPQLADDNEEGESDDSSTDTQVATRIVTPDAGTSTGGNSDQAPPPTDDGIDTAETEFPDSPTGLSRRNVALSSGLAPQSQTLTLGNNAERLDTNGRVIGLVARVQQNGQVTTAAVQLVNGGVVNAGFDPQTRLSWGRWGGEVDVEAADGTQQTFSAEDANLHFIQSVSSDGVPAVPLTGSQSFVLVGNTDPSNDTGVVGFLGSADLSANFDTQQVQSSISLSVNEQLWQATGSGRIGSAVGLGTPGNVFAGDYSSVSIDNANNGSGNFSGFFTEDAQGAGLSYRLNGPSNAVSGVAAFEAIAP